MPEPRRSQLLLVAGGAAAFALSAVTDLRALAVASAAALLLFRRGALRELRRVAVLVAPPVAILAAGSWGWGRLGLPGGEAAAAAPFLALALRSVLVAFVTFSVLRRADVLRALAPFPLLSRLAVLTLAQVHALRRVASDSALGLRSRMARRPTARDVVANAAGVTAGLLSISVRHARESAEAIRSRGG